MLKSRFLLFVMLLLSACAPSPLAIQTAIAETQVGWTKTPSPTRIPVSEINIDPAIIQPEDLGLEVAEMQGTNPGIWPLANVYDGDYHFSRKLIDKKGDFVGWVSISVFESPKKLEDAFNIARANVSAHGFDACVRLGGDPATCRGLGVIMGSPSFAEKSVVYNSYDGLRGIIFVSGRALISVALNDKSVDAIIYYSEALNKRLTPIISD